MVVTPWGDSDSLRARRLRPGPGGARDEVEQNQRERLFGAMVAVVAEKGYQATTVADLVELSGVSSRTFYDLFPDKRACFMAAMETMVEAAVAAAADAVSGRSRKGGRGSWEARARAGSRAFAEIVVAQPAAARMCLVEAYAAGPKALAPLEEATAGFEALAQQMLAQSPQRAEMPAEMTSAYIGAIQEIVRMRLLAGREAELPGLMDELWDLIGSYRPPPKPLRLTGRLPAARPESLEAHDRAERALRAFAIVVAEQGYAETTVEQVVRRASMSTTTFYAHFKGKEDALMAALDSAGAQMGAAIRPAVRRASDWPTSIRAGFGALFNFLASRPALAQLVAVEVCAARAAAMERRVEYLQPLEELLAEGHESSTETPAVTTELIAGVVYALAYRQIREAGPQSLPSLAPICTYLALAPFIGAEKACAVANEDGGRGRRRTRAQEG
jgi:AcrR family transcriptional regulator